MTTAQEEKVDRVLSQNLELFAILQGTSGKLGLLQKTEIMWRVHVWALCTLSAAMGAVGAMMLRHYFWP